MYKKSVLANGIRIVTDELPYVKSITLGIWVSTGSRHEQDHNQGISHFIEHLLFKGTKNRSAKDIAEQIDEVGGQLNAFTSKEYTCYYIKLLDTHLQLGMEILTDMLLNSKFDAQDILREKEVVVEEYNMYEDTPDELVHDLYLSHVFPNHPIGRNILGTRNSITNFSTKLVNEYYQANYTPGKIVVAAAGNLKHQDIMRLTEQLLGNISGENLNHKLQRPIYNPSMQIISKKTEQVHICLGTQGVTQSSPDLYAIHVLNNIIGGSASSRLFQAIREERGLAYSIFSYQSNYTDCGLFSIYAGTRPDNTKQVIHLIMDTIYNIAEQGVTEKELYKAKEQLKGSLLLGLESSSSRMSRIGKQEVMLEKYITPEEIVQEIDAVTMEKLEQLCVNVFAQQKFSCVTLGPISEKEIPENYFG